MEKIIKFESPESHIDSVVSVLYPQVDQIEKYIKNKMDEVEELKQKRDNILNFINDINIQKNYSESDPAAHIDIKSKEYIEFKGTIKDHYHKSVGSWWSKVSAIFEEQKKVLFANDVKRIIFEKEPDKFQDEIQQENAHRNIFALLSNKYKIGALKRIKVGYEYLYGFNDWFTDDGAVKEEYKNETTQ